MVEKIDPNMFGSKLHKKFKRYMSIFYNKNQNWVQLSTVSITIRLVIFL